MKPKPYPTYKPSGVEWLGDVPEHWEVKRLGYLVSKIGSGKTPRGGADVYKSDGVMLIRSQNVYDTGLRLEDVVFVDESVDEEMMGTRVRPHDVLLNITGASLGRCAIAPVSLPQANVNQHVCIIRPTPSRADANFIHRSVTSFVVQSQILGYENGSSREGLNFQQVRKLVLTLPPLSEQRSIAAYLDRETGRVDRLVAKKRELIERLKEKRTALISLTVTRGLPPAAARAAGIPEMPPLKPSGVEWLGEIPQHWEVKKIKFVAKMESGHTPSKSAPSNWVEDECVIPWVSLNDTKHLKEHDYIGDTAIRISHEGMKNSSAHLLPAGVVVFTRDATIGLTAITTCPAAVSQHIIAWVPGPKITPKYLLLSFKAMQQYLESFTFGSTLKTIGMTDVRKLVTPVPPLPEQAAIAAYLDEETAKLDALVGKVEEAVERLQEYRTALITAAVTGKIDVRNYE